MDFMTDRTALLVPVAGLEEAFADQPQLVNYEAGHQWARIDPARLGTTMRHVFEHPTTAGASGSGRGGGGGHDHGKLFSSVKVSAISLRHAAAMGRRAREHMVAHFSREVVAERVEAELRRVVSVVRARRQPRRVSKLGNP
jgi:hypothetical protein